METHFGLHIAKNDKFDALQDIAARLFICPRIWPEKATKMLDTHMFVDKLYARIKSVICRPSLIRFNYRQDHIRWHFLSKFVVL